MYSVFTIAVCMPVVMYRVRDSSLCVAMVEFRYAALGVMEFVACPECRVLYLLNTWGRGLNKDYRRPTLNMFSPGF